MSDSSMIAVLIVRLRENGRLNVLLDIKEALEWDLRELRDNFNGDILKNKYPDEKERLKASCPLKFQGSRTFTMRAAIKEKHDLIVAMSNILNDKKIYTMTVNKKLHDDIRRILNCG